SGIDGILSVDGTAASSGRILQWKGRVTLERAKFAQRGTPGRRPVVFDFALEHNSMKHSGALRTVEIHIGKAAASLTGTFAQRGESTVLNMHLRGQAMPVSELVEMLPPLDIVLPSGSSLQGGTADVDATLDGPASGL